MFWLKFEIAKETTRLLTLAWKYYCDRQDELGWQSRVNGVSFN